jgi:putative hydrolase of the HAD superfamily
MSIETLLFDLDDTLIIEYSSIDDSFAETIRQIENNIDRNAFIKSIRDQAQELWAQLPAYDYCRKIGISSWDALWVDFTEDIEPVRQLNDLSGWFRFETWHRTLNQFNIHDRNIAIRLSNEFKKIRSSRHHLYPETLEILNRLKGSYKLGLITNGAPDVQWKKIDGGHLKHYFDCIIISGYYGLRKPDERLFHAAMTALKGNTAHSIMIGNSLNSDIKGANKSGIKTIWINRNKIKMTDIKPDYEIDNLLNIEQILKIENEVGNNNQEHIF